MYKDDEIIVIRRKLLDETKTEEWIKSQVDKVLEEYSSPYRVCYVALFEYPARVTIRANDDYGDEPDENSLDLVDDGYERVSSVLETLAVSIGARWVGFPGYYWSK